LLLGAANVCVSYSVVSFVTARFPVGVMPAKVLTESFLFIANFALQRDFVFARRSPAIAPPMADPVAEPAEAPRNAIPAALNTNADVSS